MTQYFKIALVGLAAVAAFASCEKDETLSQKEIESHLTGAWKVYSINGEPALTEDIEIVRYLDNGKLLASAAYYEDALGSNVWNNRQEYTYTIDGNIISSSNGNMDIQSKIIYIDDQKMELDWFKQTIDGIEQNFEPLRYVYHKFDTDYSEDVIGRWEGKGMGPGESDIRINFKKDGTITIYQHFGNDWVPQLFYAPEYFVDGDCIFARWQLAEDSSMQYEIFNIDSIKDGVMKWSAIREDENGTRYNETYSWQKTELPSDQEIKKNLVGKWKTLSINGVLVETAERNILSFNDGGTGTYSASRYDTTMEEYTWYNKNSFTYSFSNGILTENIEAENIDITAEVLRADEDLLVIEFNTFSMDGKKTSITDLDVFQRVTVDYSDDVIGLWECENYVDVINDIRTKVRIELSADGSYKYYEYADGEWKKSEDTSNDYIVDGDWIAVRYRTDMDTFTFAAWDINEVKEGTMKWSYLIKKADGTPLTTTIDWKRVD